MSTMIVVHKIGAFLQNGRDEEVQFICQVEGPP